jgi:hypothetical protein
MSNALKNKTINLFLFFVVILFPWLFIWQCGDLTDTGFMATNYLFFFEDLSNGRTNSYFFLSNLVGAVWFEIFPELGILGLKILYIVFLYICIFFSYLILKGDKTVTNKTLLFLFLLIGISFSERYTMLIYSYDIFSWAFLLISLFFLLLGLKSSDCFSFFKGLKLYIILSGFFFAVAVFGRITDIILVAMLPMAFFIKEMVEQEGIRMSFIKKSLIETLKFSIGFSIGIALFILILSMAGVYNVYFANLFPESSFGGSSYGPAQLLKRYFYDCVGFIKHFGILASMVAVFIFVHQKISPKLRLAFLLGFILILVFASISLYSDYSYKSNIKFLYPSICLPILGLSLLKRDHYSNILSFVLIFSIAQVFGSNTGIFLKLSYSAILIVPLSGLIFFNANLLPIPTVYYRLSKILFALLFLFSIVSRWNWIYNFPPNAFVRFRAVHKIESPRMQGIYTLKERAEYINRVVKSISCYKKQHQNLFIFGHRPLLYYLTDSRPAIKNFWLANNTISVNNLFNELEISAHAHTGLPLILDGKDGIMGEPGRVKLSEFLIKNGYILVEDQVDFALWIRY